MTAPAPSPTDRRPLRTRSWPLFINIARKLAAWHIPPNAISIAGMLAAVIAGGEIAAAFRIGADNADLTGRAPCSSSPPHSSSSASSATSSTAWSPSRASSAHPPASSTTTSPTASPTPPPSSHRLRRLFLPELGYIAALIAVMTAYIRGIAARARRRHDFSGLMDKRQRMFVMTLTCIILAVAPRSIDHAITIADHTLSPWTITLALIAAGSLITCLTRLRNIARKLNTQP